MPGTLFLVATPIGNLEDITLRALRVLREATVIAAEDTRRTAKLLNHHAIATPTISFHEHNTRTRIPQLLRRLEAGESVALVTDAGTPGVSDPGVELVRACIEAGIAVDPVPGASAPLAAALASGFPMTPLRVLGFAPSKAKDRTGWLRMISAVPETLTFFESPYRVKATLEAAGEYLGNRPICVAREVTKIHQEFIRGTSSEVLRALGDDPKGEFTIVIGPMPELAVAEGENGALADEDVAAEFGLMANCGRLGRREAVAAVARKFGRPTREIYAAIERAKK